MDPLAEIAELKARIERLERMAGLESPAPSVPSPPPVPTPVSTLSPSPLLPEPVGSTPESPPPLPPLPPVATPQTASLATSEAWLARIGIGLLFIGLLFFLKLSLDRGWITPLLQLAIGTGVCLFLLIWGDRVSRYRPSMGNLTFGGGIAGLIGVLAAGQHLYHLYGGLVTCALSLAIALICFGQSLRRDSPVLCILALLGISLAPFFLGLHEITLLAIDGLIAAALALATYFVRGWRGVLWAGAITSWTLLFSAVATKWFTSAAGEQGLIQAAIIFVWLGFWLVPVSRFLWKNPTDIAGLWLTAFLPGLAAMLASAMLWGEGSRGAIGGGLLVLGGLSAALGWATRTRAPLAATQFCAAGIFGGLAIPVILSGFTCWLVISAYALALHFAAKATRERPLQALAYLATLVCYGAFFVISIQIATDYERDWALTISALALLSSVAGATFLTSSLSLIGVFRIFTYLGAIFLILAEMCSGSLSGAWAVFLCAIVALASWLGAFGQRSSGQQVLAHAIFGLLAPFVLFLLLNERSPTPWLNPSALSACGIFALALVPGLRMRPGSGRLIYLGVLHVMGLILLWTQFREVGDGAAVSVSWAVSAVALIIGGVFKDSRPLRLAGMATLVLLLIRLFIVDLAQLDLAAKTLIFLGIGLLLFAAGYFLPKFLPSSSHKAP